MSQNMDLGAQAFAVLEYFIVFLFALCFHEFAHGWVARARGDRTAEIMGRLTLNPMVHADMIGTVILPLMAAITGRGLFGWAKPVPVDERNLKNPRVDMFWIAFAGPLSNLLLAFLGAIGLGLYHRFYGSSHIEEAGARELLHVFTLFIQVNVVLAVFNMIPIHPLDGAKVLARFLPRRLNDQLEAFAMQSSLLLLMVFMLYGSVISGPASWVFAGFISLADKVAFI